MLPLKCHKAVQTTNISGPYQSYEWLVQNSWTEIYPEIYKFNCIASS